MVREDPDQLEGRRCRAREGGKAGTKGGWVKDRDGVRDVSYQEEAEVVVVINCKRASGGETILSRIRERWTLSARRSGTKFEALED